MLNNSAKQFRSAAANAWNFEPSGSSISLRYRRVMVSRHIEKRPAAWVLAPITKQPRWIVFFIYTPHGILTKDQIEALTRLRGEGLPVLVICAAPSIERVPVELRDFSESLYWKGLTGYDFSAYTLALEEIAAHSPHADVLIMNDSMYGPFYKLGPFIDDAAWTLTGFTGSSNEENHIQSYAFILKDVCVKRVQQLRSIFFERFAFSNWRSVVLLQELRLARIAQKTMTVGAYWYLGRNVVDPCLIEPFYLVDNGFPFLKKSLVGKMSQFQARKAITETLERFSWPQ